MKENLNKEPGPTLTKVLLLFVSVINTLRANLGFGSTSRRPGGCNSWPFKYTWHVLARFCTLLNANVAPLAFPEELCLSPNALMYSETQNKPGPRLPNK